MWLQPFRENRQDVLQLQSVLLRGVHPIDALPWWLLRMRTCAHPMVTTLACWLVQVAVLRVYAHLP